MHSTFSVFTTVYEPVEGPAEAETRRSITYRVADKSLARPWKETSYSNQDLQHCTNTYGVQTTGIYSCCLYAISLGTVL